MNASKKFRTSLVLTFAFANTIAAAPRDTKAVTPVTQPSNVVCNTVNPNELMISEYWLVRPFAISWDQACRKNSHDLWSFNASINLTCGEIL